MRSSTLPTGTVRDESQGSRTFPESTPQSHQPSHPNHPSQPSRPTSRRDESSIELQTEVDRLRREKQQATVEIDRLESKLNQLESQVASYRESQQALVDRYEQVISELEAAAAATRQPAEASNTSGLWGRLKQWLL